MWGVHIPFIEGLTLSGAVGHCEEAVSRLGNLLRWHGGLHRHLVPLLWRLLAHSRPSKDTQRKLLRAARRKIASHPHSLTHLRHESNSSGDTVINGTTSVENLPVIQPLDASAIRDAFVHMLFLHKNTKSKTLIFKDMHDWALDEVRDVFHAHTGYDKMDMSHDSSSWHNLNILSLTHNPADATTSRIKNLDLISAASGVEVVDWVLVCAMVAVQELFSRKPSLQSSTDSSLQVPPETQTLVRTIWVLWCRDSGKRIRPTSVSCCAIVTFMRLAIITQDAVLRDAVTRYVGDGIVVPALLGEISCHPQSWRSVSIEFAVMSVMFGTGHFLDIFDSLRDHRLEFSGGTDEGWRNVLANSVLQRILDHDVAVALQLYRSCGEAQIEIHECVLVSLGRASINAGYLIQTLHLLRVPNLSRQSRMDLFNAFLSRFDDHD